MNIRYAGYRMGVIAHGQEFASAIQPGWYLRLRDNVDAADGRVAGLLGLLGLKMVLDSIQGKWFCFRLFHYCAILGSMETVLMGEACCEGFRKSRQHCQYP